MSERRSFLRAASLLPLGVLANASSAIGATDTSAENFNAQAEPLVNSAPPPPPPPQPPIKEEPFPDYHLLGKPDRDAHLFGDERPQHWRDTKQGLVAALKGAAKPDDPIHDWIKTFTISFDERSSAIVLEAVGHLHRTKNPGELKYEPELYEASLRGAAALLDRCLRYRNEMGGFEMSGISAGIGYLSFIRLKPLQRNFLIQSNSADLAKIEQVTESIVGHRYRQVGGIDRLFERRQLQAKVAEADGNAEEAGRAEVKDDFLSMLLQKQFHLQIDAQLAQFTRLLSPGSSSNFAERYLRMLAMLAEDLSDAFCKLFSTAKGVQQVLSLSKITVAMSSIVDVDIPAFSTIVDIGSWIDKVIPADPSAQRKPDVLDALVLWTRALMRELDTRSQYETEFTVSVPLNQTLGKGNPPILKSDDVKAAFGPGGLGKISFTLPSNSLPIAAKQNDIRVVAVGLTVEASIDAASPIQYTPNFPTTLAAQVPVVEKVEQQKMARLNATVNTPAQTQVGGGTYSRPPLFLPNVRIQGGNGGDLEAVLSYDPACRGLNPFGSWTITMDPNVVEFFADPNPQKLTDAWITGLVLHLRVRGTLETI